MPTAANRNSVTRVQQAELQSEKAEKKQTLNEQPTEEVQQPAELPAAPIERSSGMESFIKYSRCFSMGLMNV